MDEKCAFLQVTKDCHAEDAHWAAEVFDVKRSSECSQELACPSGIVAEDEDIIDINGNVDHQGWGNERVAGAVAFELMEAIVC